MPIIGTTLNAIEATKNKVPVEGEVKVNSTPRITGMREVDLDALGKKAVAMEFTFGSTYEPGLANIVVKGEILYVGPKQAAVLKQWKEKDRPKARRVALSASTARPNRKAFSSLGFR